MGGHRVGDGYLNCLALLELVPGFGRQSVINPNTTRFYTVLNLGPGQGLVTVDEEAIKTIAVSKPVIPRSSP